MPLDLLQPLGLDIDEDEIVYGRHYRLALAPSRSGQLDALHGYEALDVDVVEEALDLQFSGVCHTQSIPVFGSVVHCNLYLRTNVVNLSGLYNCTALPCAMSHIAMRCSIKFANYFVKRKIMSTFAPPKRSMLLRSG